MNRFELARHLKTSPPIDRIFIIQDLCRGKSVLDLGCIRHSATVALADPNWLHGKIREVAESLVGIDYIPEEVKKLCDAGFDIRCRDVTGSLMVNKFDVIVAADLIEHLTNIDRFFTNCHKHLNDGGILIITTPNPFYADGYRYVTLKGNYLMNPEHTCWIDPYALSLLSARYGFKVVDARFITGGWKLGDVILEGEGHEYDIQNDTWHETKAQEILRHIVKKIWPSFKASVLTRYADHIIVLKSQYCRGERQ